MKKILLALILFFIAVPLLAVAKVPKDIWQEYVYWNKMVRKYPKGPISHFNLAMTMAYMGKIEEGSAMLNKTEELDPDIVERLLKLYKKKAAKEPNNWRWHFRLGFIYYFEGKKDKALKQFEWVSKSEPVGSQNAWAYGYIAVIKGDQKKWHRAVEACQKGLEIEPDGAALHAALSKAYYEQQKIIEASAEMVKALRLNNEFKEYEQKRWEQSR